MKNLVADGNTVTVAAPAAVTSGDGVLVGSMFGVAQTDAANGADVVIVTTGVFDLPKVGSQGWSVGVKVYWDNGNSQCTTATAGNTLIGVAVASVGNGVGDTTGRVRLNGSY